MQELWGEKTSALTDQHTHCLVGSSSLNETLSVSSCCSIVQLCVNCAAVFIQLHGCLNLQAQVRTHQTVQSGRRTAFSLLSVWLKSRYWGFTYNKWTRVKACVCVYMCAVRAVPLKPAVSDLQLCAISTLCICKQKKGVKEATPIIFFNVYLCVFSLRRDIVYCVTPPSV